jgi:PEGA domain-containing protein
MKRSILATYITAAALAFAVPALAQESRPSNAPGNNANSGGRPSGGSESTGSAAPRGGGGGGSSAGSPSSSSSSAGSASSRGGSSTSMPSTGGSSFSDVGSRPRAPERRSGDFAIPRGGNEGSFVGRGGITRPSSASPATSAAIGSVNGNTDVRRAVPAYSRPREGRPIVGDAIDRASLPPSNIVVLPPGNPWYGYGCWDCYYGGYPGYAWGPWYGGYGFGLGYFYDPFGYYGYYSPYNYDAGYSGGYGSGRYSYNSGGAVGQLRLKVSPKHGQVYVDGYFAGEVDNFDGTFQRLSIEAGSHKVEIRAEGFETVTFDVMVTPGETVTYKGTLKPISK